MANKKFLDEDGLRQVWAEVLKHDNDAKDAAISAADSATDEKLKSYLKSTDVVDAVTDAIKFERISNYKASPDVDPIDAIVLKNSNDEVIGVVDVADFVVDGMLQNVELKNNKLEFTFNTAAGDHKIVPVDLGDYIDVYTGAAGEIKIENNEISIEGVGGEKVDVKTIPVAGTPLADILNENGITSIDAGNLQSVLEALFSKNTWPAAPSGSDKTWANWPPRTVPTAGSLSQSVPTITLSKTLVKVGEAITVEASAAAASGSVSVTYKSDAFPYGYSTANDNIRDKDGAPASVTSTNTRTSGTYTLTPEITAGFTVKNGETTVKQTIPEANISQSETAASLSKTTLVTVKGANTVRVSTTTPKFSQSIPASSVPSYWACSTLGKTSDDYKVDALTSDITFTALSGSNNKTATCNAVFPIYTNASWVNVNGSTITSKPNSTTSKNIALTATWNDVKDASTNASNASKLDKQYFITNESMGETLTTLTNGTNAFYALWAFGNGGFKVQLPSEWKIESIQTKSDTVAGQFDGNQDMGGFTITPKDITVTAAVGTEGQDGYRAAIVETYDEYNINIGAGNVCRIKFSKK